MTLIWVLGLALGGFGLFKSCNVVKDYAESKAKVEKEKCENKLTKFGYEFKHKDDKCKAKLNKQKRECNKKDYKKQNKQLKIDLKKCTESKGFWGGLFSGDEEVDDEKKD